LLIATSLQAGRAEESGMYAFSLEGAINKALKDNTIIKQAIENQKAQTQAFKSTRAKLFPRLSVSYSYTRLQDQPYAVFGGGARVPVGSQNVFHWDVTITQPLFTGYALSTRKRMAELGVESGKMKSVQAILDVTKQVKVAYYNILLAKRVLRVADEAVKQLTAHVEDARHFYDQGLIPNNDVLKSQVALAEARQQKTRAQSQLEMAVAAFNRLLKLPINAATRVEAIEHITPFSTDLETLQAEALHRRPELQNLRLDLKNAAYGVTLAKSAYYPEVALVGTYERNGDNLMATNNDYGNDHNASLTLQAKWTFFEWGRKKAETAKALHLKQALAAKLATIEDAVKLEVKRAYLDLKVAETNIRTATEAREQARENYRITDLQYRNQIASSTEVLDAQAFLTQAETNYYSALYGYMMALAELERAVGMPLEGKK
jgi:outer membrane protein TolC